MEVDATAAPEGAACALHPDQPALIVCARCGSYACQPCTKVGGGIAVCTACADRALATGTGLYPDGVDRFDFVRLYFSFEGRVSRQTWWLAQFVPVLAFGIVLALAAHYAALGAWFNIAGEAIMFWASLVVTVKRWHDRGASAWWILTVLIPIVGPLANFVVCGFLPGDPGPNRYGWPPPPRVGAVGCH